MATPSSTLAWKIPQTLEPGGIQSMGPQRVGYDWARTHLNQKTDSHKTLNLHPSWFETLPSSKTDRNNFFKKSFTHPVYGIFVAASPMRLRQMPCHFWQFYSEAGSKGVGQFSKRKNIHSMKKNKVFSGVSNSRERGLRWIQLGRSRGGVWWIRDPDEQGSGLGSNVACRGNKKQDPPFRFSTCWVNKKHSQRRHVTTRTTELLGLIVCPLIANF